MIVIALGVEGIENELDRIRRSNTKHTTKKMTEVQKALEIESQIEDGTEQCKCSKRGCKKKFHRFKGDKARQFCPEHQREAYKNEKYIK
jgi:hypothetical protein